MSLGLQIKLFNLLGVVNRLGINLIITNNDCFPNGFLSFLKCDLEVLGILDSPECLIYFDLLEEISFHDWFTEIALESDEESLRFNDDLEHLGLGSLGDLNLHVNILNTLRPIVLFCLGSIVCADCFVHLDIGLDTRSGWLVL